MSSIFPPNFGMGVFPPMAIAPKSVGLDFRAKKIAIFAAKFGCIRYF